MRFLGIDYGSKRVGLALSDEAGRLAFPFKILINRADLLELLHSICGEQEVSEIVLGESLDLSGKENEIMAEIKEFKKGLEKLGLPVHLEKEFLTTIEARRYQPDKKADAGAAALILQRYLDRKNRF